MPGILKHKITFDCETSQLHSGTIICPSRQSGRLGLLLLALLAFWMYNGIIGSKLRLVGLNEIDERNFALVAGVWTLMLIL